jgi:hypothetical protein
MAKVTRHGGPTHYEWVPFARPQIGAIDQCHGGSSTTSMPMPPTESESTEPPPLSPVPMMESPLPLSEIGEGADSVEESTDPAEVINSPAAPPKEDVPFPPTKPKRRVTSKRKPAADFDF